MQANASVMFRIACSCERISRANPFRQAAVCLGATPSQCRWPTDTHHALWLRFRSSRVLIGNGEIDHMERKRTSSGNVLSVGYDPTT